MTALGSDGRSLHPRRSATCHHHGARAVCRRFPVVVQFSAGFRILDAGNTVTGLHVADTCLVAGDAGTDIVDASFAGLVGHVRIGDLGPCHADHVGLSRRQDHFCIVGLVDSAGHEDRDRNQFLHCIGKRREIAGFDVHLRHDMDRALRPTMEPAITLM